MVCQVRQCIYISVNHWVRVFGTNVVLMYLIIAVPTVSGFKRLKTVFKRVVSLW